MGGCLTLIIQALAVWYLWYQQYQQCCLSQMFKASELLISSVQVIWYKYLHNTMALDCHILYSHNRMGKIHFKPCISLCRTFWSIYLCCYISHLELLPAYEDGFFLYSISQSVQISAQGYFRFSYEPIHSCPSFLTQSSLSALREIKFHTLGSS